MEEVTEITKDELVEQESVKETPVFDVSKLDKKSLEIL